MQKFSCGLAKLSSLLMRILFIVGTLLPVASQAQQAWFSDNVLHLPHVLVDGQIYAAELRYLENSTPIRFELLNATTAAADGLNLDAFYEDGILLIMSVDVGGTQYWAMLSPLSLEPAVFRLISGEIDDNDDDNDGQADIFDDMPWTPNLCTSPACLLEPSSTGPEQDAPLRGYTGHFRTPIIGWP